MIQIAVRSENESSSILAALHQIFTIKKNALIFAWRKDFLFFLNYCPCPHVPVTTLLSKCLNPAEEKHHSSFSKHSSGKGCSLPPPILSLISRLVWGITWAKLLIWFHTFLHSGLATEVGLIPVDRADLELPVAVHIPKIVCTASPKLLHTASCLSLPLSCSWGICLNYAQWSIF